MTRARAGWWFDADWLNRTACEPARLATLLCELGCDPPIMKHPRPWNWWSEPEHVQDMRRHHGLIGRDTCIAAKSHPGLYMMLQVYQSTGQWWDHATGEMGFDIIALVEARLHLSRAKATWRLARMIGFEKPVPLMPLRVPA